MAKRSRDYRTLLEVQALAPSTGPGTRGQSTRTPRVVDRVWADISQLTGRELEIAQQRYARATYRVETYFNEKITELAKFVLDSRTFEIGAVDDVELRGRTMVCLCDEEL